MTGVEAATIGIAVYAAVVSTFVLGWDIVKWYRSGPRLSMRATTGMKVFGDPAMAGQYYVSARVTNRGDRPTTIQSIGYKTYSSKLRELLNQADDEAFVILRPSDNQPLPHVLHPGAVWLAMTKQDDELVKLSRSKHLYIVVEHSHSDKDIRRKLTFRDSAVAPKQEKP